MSESADTSVISTSSISTTKNVVSQDQLHKFIHNLLSISGVDFDLEIPKPEVLGQFISSHLPDTLYIVQNDEEGYQVIQHLEEISRQWSVHCIIILIKSKGQLSSTSSLKNQLNILNIPVDSLSEERNGESPVEFNDSNAMFEKLRTLIHLGLAPYFDLITSNYTAVPGDSVEDSTKSSTTTSINLAKKKLNELSLSLQHLQQRIQIPELLSSVHPRVLQVIEQTQDGKNDRESLLEALVSDSSFLNDLTYIVNNWIKQIQSITRLNHDPLDGQSLTEEVQFWKSMELALVSITQQIASPEVQTSIDLLNKAKRFHVTLSFQNDTGVNEKIVTTKLYNSLLKELPIDEMISVSNNHEELDKFEISIMNLFNHLKSKMKNLNSFPLTRSIELIELALNDITSKFKSILSNFSIMSLSLPKFLELYNSMILKIFELVDQNIKFMINLVRELLRKRQEKFIIIKINQQSYNELKERLGALKDFRLNHQDLLVVLERFLKNDSFLESNKLIEAYNKFLVPINVVDLSSQGNMIWTMNEKAYMGVFKQLNELIVAKLNNLFDNCENFSDLLVVMRSFNGKSDTESQGQGLRSLISDEYKLKILSIANQETESLIDLNLNDRRKILRSIDSYEVGYKFQFTSNDSSSQSSIVSDIQWSLSLITKLNFYLENLLKLLGPNWDKYTLGSKINNEVSSLIQSLNPEKAFLAWVDTLESKLVTLERSGPIVKIVVVNNDFYDLIVNYDYSLIDYVDQLHQLTSLGFKVPTTILIQFRKVEKLYPFIIGLAEHILILKQVLEYDLIETSYGKRFGIAVEKHKLLISQSLKQLTTVDWIYLSQALDLNLISESTDSTSESLLEIQSLNILNKFQSDVYKLYEQVSKLSKFDEFLSGIYHKLRTSEFETAVISNLLKTVQSEFNQLLLEGFSDIDAVCDLINSEIQEILRLKCRDELIQIEKGIEETSLTTPSEHSIIFEEQAFLITPPLSLTKQFNLDKLNHVLSTIESQKRIKSISTEDEPFKNLASNSYELTELIGKILNKVDRVLAQGEEYFNQWKLLQTLWELNLNNEDDSIKIILPNADLSQWLEAVNKILKVRKIFDTPETSKEFGKILRIDFSKVQSRVSLKFDYFQTELLNKYSRIIQEVSITLNNRLVTAKQSLEHKLNFQIEVSKLVTNLDQYLSYESDISKWNQDTKIIKRGQMILVKQRFKFEGNWIFVEQLENILSILTALLKRKQELIQDNFEIISSKIRAESIRINDLIKSLIQEWPVKKPVSGNLNPSLAITHLDAFQTRCSILESEKSSIFNVSKSLNIPVELTQGLASIMEEIRDLKSVWSSINTLWEDLERVKTFKWSEVQPRGLRRQLDDLLTTSRSLPSMVRQYSAFDEIQNVIKTHLKNHNFIIDLKNDSMKPRHWKILLSQLGAERMAFENMTIGDVWSLNLTVNEATIKSMLTQASNEQTIEDNLNQIKNEWSQITFEMFNYETKCRLVKNWNKLFDQCNNDIHTLSSMSGSPYYHSFEQEITAMEDKLNRLYVLLDTWIDVQREWVYLDGVFGNQNNDIKNLLPIESTRFTNITYEFLNTLKRVYKFNLVIDILLVGDLQTVMDKLLESLIRVRKSLTDYLEKQRELCPRFYFIGNEDLLEIIGGSTDIDRINRHFKKMFAGISSVIYRKESSTIVGIKSEQGEEVTLNKPVSLIKYPRLNEWLKELEVEVQMTLSKLTKDGLEKYEQVMNGELDSFSDLIFELPAQAMTLVVQIVFTSTIESALLQPKALGGVLEKYSTIMKSLSALLASSMINLQRLKVQYLVIEILHQKEVVNTLVSSDPSQLPFLWSIQQKFYYDKGSSDPITSLVLVQANAKFIYGFEYLGIPEKLAYTPLINKCFLTMTQALAQKLGGSPFGPAGTGKTESIKALGNTLGKMVLVFNCDDSFDFQSMGRIFLGLCKVGSWGCFDEFNRLDENILSAVSSQIEAIEVGLSSHEPVEISGKSLSIHPETGIFVTMNPGYVGRYELPENLKKLFRGFSMERPDREIIVEILLTSQTFLHAKEVAKVIVPLFLEIEAECSKQPHYDFGLRALKNTLVRCGNIKRSRATTDKDNRSEEFKLVLQSIQETISPKLIKEDEAILNDLVAKYFPGLTYESDDYSEFIIGLEKYCDQHGLYYDDQWTTKALQLNQIQATHHGVMLVGESGSSKSTIWKSVLETLTLVDGVDHLSFVLDCKVLSKGDIYGYLDPVTRDWTDGLFTSILRKIRSNLRGELSKRIWIVFDGDIDPEWAENLNSVLDDNKILTLPNGERLGLPENVRLVFEVDSLKFTTPATISRCGMVWFDTSLVPTQGLLGGILFDLSNNAIEVGEELSTDYNEVLAIQKDLARDITEFIDSQTINEVIREAKKIEHIMDFTVHRTLQSFSTLLKSYFRRLIAFKLANRNIPVDNTAKYIGKATLLSLIWAFAGDSSLIEREQFGVTISQIKPFESIEISGIFIDHDISIPEFEWEKWSNKVESIELEPQHVSNPNTVVPTMDTARHEYLIYSILNEHKPLLLCGPPGSGKTMTLLEALRKSPSMDVLSLNFSKETSPESLMKSLEQHCTYKKTSNGVVLTPIISGKWVVVFCDEVNLPGTDKYGTQRVISLMRQMIEHQGFWRIKDRQWVSLANIQFVGACNSPKDPGRQRLSERFLRHVSVVMVDYPGTASLVQIYQTFNLAVMKCAPDLRGFTRATTDAMIEIYTKTKDKLTLEVQDHYIYSPRELTRWSRSLLEGLKAREYSDLSSLARLWNHEGLRLFYDRLVNEEERTWTKELFREVTLKHFQNIDIDSALKEPILFSNWLTSNYEAVEEAELRSFVSERLRVFSDEEIEVDLVLHGDLLDHALRIDRVLRQPQGHLILVGPSTSGKTTLSKFVAWMNGLKVVQLNVNRNYGIDEFDATLREILLRCARGDRMCFIIDEASILETAFIERMNTLLANAEIPGLFEREEFASLMNICLEQSHSQGLLLDSTEELYSWFTRQISENLHVIFNISETTKSTKRPAVISSPALFNRCVLSWMGDWSENSLFDIASSLIESVPLDMSSYSIPGTFNQFISSNITGFRDVVVDAFVYFHRYILDYESFINVKSTPSNFISFIAHFTQYFNSKQFELEENQRHISTGLDKLRETVVQVNVLKGELSEKQEFLKMKDQEAKIMLNKMLTDQNEAERKQEFSVATQEELEKQEVEIQRRRARVMKDLEKAEPAVLEAQRGVQNIKKQHLTEIRSMTNPPAAVKMTMESVCILIGYEVSTWRDVQLIVRRDDFITNIVTFNNEEQLSTELREYMEQVYLSRSEYNYEAVYRASKACGPLLQWVEAQLTYSRILQSIGPLREEVRTLEDQTKKTRAQLIAIDQMIHELEDSINGYKEDYSSLIRDAENIKSEMKGVQLRVDRSLKLIDNLTNERERWKVSIKRFGEQRERLIGNSLLAAAFVVYSGVYDQRGRELLMKVWKRKLSDSGITYDDTFTVTNYLNNGSEVLAWEQSGLVYDDLNVENFTIMKASGTPIIIDPSSAMINILTKSYGSRKTVVTSFLNEGFLKQLENSIRFGGVIIIQDAEFYDPVLNTVLKKEIHRNGGRMMINLGDSEIDYSSEFKLFLHTKDSSIDLSSFVSSRCTVVNFTVTSGSLQNKILNITLQDLKPEIEQKRLEIAGLQSEYTVRLHTLEEELLNSLSDTTGSILENDLVIDTLETLKSESTEIDKKIKESLGVMDAVEQVRNTYDDVAKHSSRIFNILKQMNELCKLYKFTLESFIDIFMVVLGDHGSNVSVADFILELYKEAFATIAPSLIYHDKIVLALCMSLSYYGFEIGGQVETAARLILNYYESGVSDRNLTSIFEATLVRYEDNDVDSILAANPDNESFKLLFSFIKSLQSTKRDSLLDEIYKLSSFLFTGNAPYSTKYELTDWVSKSTESNSIVPIILASPEGYDATFKVEKAAQDARQKLVIVSMGSKEGVEMANKELSVASSKNHWILIQNIQLSPQWMNYLERKLDSIGWSPHFKVFLTCNLTSKISPALVTKSKVLVFENQPGLKNVLLETFSSIPLDILNSGSTEFRHVCFLLVFLHSVIEERLRFAPVSFKKKYDINDSDFTAGLKVIQKLFEPFKSKTNISPELISWEELSYLIGEITYGGKIDDKEDLSYITGLANYLFRVESFDSKFNLIENEQTQANGSGLEFPEGIDVESYTTWIRELPDQGSLSWIGLDEEVDILLREKQGQEVAKAVLKLTQSV